MVLDVLAFFAIVISIIAAVSEESVMIFIVGVGGGLILIGLGTILDSLRQIFKLLKKISQKLSEKNNFSP